MLLVVVVVNSSFLPFRVLFPDTILNLRRCNFHRTAARWKGEEKNLGNNSKVNNSGVSSIIFRLSRKIIRRRCRKTCRPPADDRPTRTCGSTTICGVLSIISLSLTDKHIPTNERASREFLRVVLFRFRRWCVAFFIWELLSFSPFFPPLFFLSIFRNFPFHPSSKRKMNRIFILCRPRHRYKNNIVHLEQLLLK